MKAEAAFELRLTTTVRVSVEAEPPAGYNTERLKEDILGAVCPDFTELKEGWSPYFGDKVEIYWAMGERTDLGVVQFNPHIVSDHVEVLDYRHKIKEEA